MQLTTEQRVFVVTTYIRTGSIRQVQHLFEECFPDRRSQCKSVIQNNVRKYQTKGTCLNLNKGCSGRRKTVITEENTEMVRTIIQENETVSCRKNNSHLSKSSFNPIVKRDLKWYPYKMHLRHQLTDNDYKGKITSVDAFKPERNLQKQYKNLIISRSKERLVCLFMTDNFSECSLSVIVENKPTLCSQLTLSEFKNGISVPLFKTLYPNNGLRLYTQFDETVRLAMTNDIAFDKTIQNVVTLFQAHSSSCVDTEKEKKLVFLTPLLEFPRKNFTPYTVGQRVAKKLPPLPSTSKLSPKFEGPLVVREVDAHGVTYRVTTLDGRNLQTVHVNQLKPCQRFSDVQVSPALVQLGPQRLSDDGRLNPPQHWTRSSASRAVEALKAIALNGTRQDFPFPGDDLAFKFEMKENRRGLADDLQLAEEIQAYERV
ncbi:Protein of unknown function DUF4817 [Trinorchestia longiramus]|nr:Protein of unknown function DUF4817 [Trinorchestia longiramus]